jgi:hypothetical protein
MLQRQNARMPFTIRDPRMNQKFVNENIIRNTIISKERINHLERFQDILVRISSFPNI